MEVCAICLDELNEDVTTLPDCKHRLHTKCLMSHCQYDVRCPVCREIPEGVEPRMLVRVVDWHDIEREIHNAEELFHNEWQNYMTQRRQLLRRRTDIHRTFLELTNVRQTLTRVERTTQKLFDKRSTDLWKLDPELSNMKKERTKLRRRETILDRKLNETLFPILGPEPNPTY